MGLLSESSSIEEQKVMAWRCNTMQNKIFGMQKHCRKLNLSVFTQNPASPWFKLVLTENKKYWTEA